MTFLFQTYFKYLLYLFIYHSVHSCLSTVIKRKVLAWCICLCCHRVTVHTTLILLSCCYNLKPISMAKSNNYESFALMYVFTVPREIALFVITVSQTWISPHLTAGQGVFSHHSFSKCSNVSSQGQLIQTCFWRAVCRLDLLLMMSSGSASSSCHCEALIYITLMIEGSRGSFRLFKFNFRTL